MERKLGCLSTSGILAAIVTAIIILVLAVTTGGAMFSPGELNAQRGESSLGGVRSHSELSRSCDACHVSPWQAASMDDRCLECHQTIATQMKDTNTLHGALMKDQALACRACHPEHRGENAPLTEMNTTDFPHEVVGFSLKAHSRHANGTNFTCKDCHTTALTQFNIAVCADCHRDLDADFMKFHTAAFGESCLGCHDGVETYGADFDHNQYFVLEGEHASAACGGCHKGARTVAEFRQTPQECYACHAEQDAHNGQFGQDCAVCHTPVSWEQTTFDHARTNFPLQGKHSQVECEECHQNDVFVGTPTDCYACHKDVDPHEGQFGTDCAACHSPAAWDQVTFDHAVFPLEGGHANVECEACHQGGQYKGTPSECVACHQKDDAHNGQFGTDCAACHQPTRWEDVQFDHAIFPLEGGHANVECKACHQGGQYKGTPSECVACHEDPAFHRGMFGTDCASCHSITGWSPAQYNRPHTFPLNHGKSGRVACSVCHPSNFNTYTCYGCHEHNPVKIERKHRKEGISNFTNCSECHPTGREHEGRGGDDD